jgi:hypothetical protein
LPHIGKLVVIRTQAVFVQLREVNAEDNPILVSNTPHTGIIPRRVLVAGDIDGLSPLDMGLRHIRLEAVFQDITQIGSIGSVIAELRFLGGGGHGHAGVFQPVHALLAAVE